MAPHQKGVPPNLEGVALVRRGVVPYPISVRAHQRGVARIREEAAAHSGPEAQLAEGVVPNREGVAPYIEAGTPHLEPATRYFSCVRTEP